MIHVGVDPGKHGALVALGDDTTGWAIQGTVMPLAGDEIDAKGVAEFLWGVVLNNAHDAVVCVEKVGAMPKQGVVSTFTFGVGYGKILGVCGALGLRVERVTPQAWKKVVLAGTAKDKDAAIAACRLRWPGFNLIPEGCRTPHDGLADALCLADYARRTWPT